MGLEACLRAVSACRLAWALRFLIASTLAGLEEIGVAVGSGEVQICLSCNGYFIRLNPALYYQIRGYLC